MKKITAILLTLFLILQFQNIKSQNIIPISGNLSFYSLNKDIKINNIGDTTLLLNADTKMNCKLYHMSNGNASFTLINKKDNNNFDLFNIVGDKTKENRIKNNIESDTLYFVFDTVYGWGTGPLIWISKYSNMAGSPLISWKNDTTGYVIVEHDSMNFVVIMPKSFNINVVFKYGYYFSHTDTLHFSSVEATHPIEINPVDENGDSLKYLQGDLKNGFSCIIELSNGGNFYGGFEVPSEYNFIMSDYYKGKEKVFFDSELANHSQGSFPSYLIEYPIYDSITDTVYYTNNPSGLVTAVTRYNYNYERDYNIIGFGFFDKYKGFTGSYTIMGFINSYQDYAWPYWEGRVSLSMQNSTEFGYCLQHFISYSKQGETVNYLSSNYFDEFEDSISGFYYFEPNHDVHYINNYDTLFIGNGFKYYWNIWTNTSGILHTYGDKRGMWDNFIYTDSKYDSWVLLDSSNNTVSEGNNLEAYVSGLTPQKYTFVQTNLFSHFNGFTGLTTQKSHINFANSDITPPVINNIYVMNDNHTVKYRFDPQEHVILRFTASDFITYSNNHDGIGFKQLPDFLTRIYIKQHASNEWVEAYVNTIYNDSIIGSQYQSDLSGMLDNDSTMYDIKITTEDNSGNTTEYILSPAFIYGAFSVGILKNKFEKPSKFSCKIFPNPAINELIISNLPKNFKIINYDIYSSDFKKIKYGKPFGNRNIIDVSMLPKGIYRLMIYDKKNNFILKSFIKL